MYLVTTINFILTLLMLYICSSYSTIFTTQTFVLLMVIVALAFPVLILYGIFLKRSLHDIKKEANEDSLTALYNRRYIDNFDYSDLAGSSIAITCIDVDHFKKINDTHGHSTGDLVLKSISRIILDNIHYNTKGVRIGGDEIVLLSQESHSNDIYKMLIAIKEKINFCNFLSDIKITISIGMAYCEKFDGDKKTFDSLYKHADLELYRAKREGRNKICTSLYIGNDTRKCIIKA